MSKSKEANALKVVHTYLIKQNRPYSAQDVFQNVGKELGKTAVVKSLENLASSGKIVEKVYGKQKVYGANQNDFQDVNESELKKMDDNIVELNGQIQMLKEETQTLEYKLKSLNSSMSTDEARAALSEIFPGIEKMRTNLSKLKEGRVLISKEEKEKVYSNHTKMVKEWRKRKRISTDIVSAILEGCPKTKKQLHEDIGIETDEEYNVKPPDL